MTEPINREKAPATTEGLCAVIFPDGRKIGTLHVRDPAETKWARYCEASGTVELPAGKLVRLEVAEMVFGPADAQGLLSGIDLSHFAEIELWFPIDSGDMIDCAVSGTRWVESLLADAAAKTKSLLNTDAKIIVKAVSLDEIEM